ncbi:hypothetical protein BDV12DRAFT_162183 [Aspergillus spectabilis]
MSADQLLYPMDFSNQQDEWLDFDALFQLPCGYLDSNPTSVESISPRDLDQSLSDSDFLNWDSDPAVFSQAMFPDFANYDSPVGELSQPALDPLPSFINPNDVLQQVPMPSQNHVVDPGFDSAWLPDAQSYSSFRYVVESQAALDTRCFSQKVKRRDASIALHLQRTSNQLSSPVWSESSFEVPPHEPPSATPAISPVSMSQKSSSPVSGSEPGASSMELVLDLNMNTTTNVPKKQKPRSKAQRENYIRARKYGVCEKHRKQHKRCNCLEKAAAAHLNADVSCAGANTIPGLRTNHERVVVTTSAQRSVQSPTGSTSTNTGSLHPLVKQLVRVSRPDLSALPAQPSPTSSAGCEQVTMRRPTNVQKAALSSTLPAQPFIASTGHDRVTPKTTQLLVTNDGSLQTPGLFRDKSQKTQHTKLRLDEERSRQVLRDRVDAQTQSGSRGTLHLQTSGVADTPLTERVGTLARRTAVGLLSFLQSPPFTASLAGSLLGRFAIFSSRLIIQSRKGMGFV